MKKHKAELKETLIERIVAMIMMDLKRAEECADREGWIDADALEKELED